jgi:hypothetical protein
MALPKGNCGGRNSKQIRSNKQLGSNKQRFTNKQTSGRLSGQPTRWQRVGWPNHNDLGGIVMATQAYPISKSDPTIEELRSFLASADEFEREAAIYWFASDWHSGQWSNLYMAVCASEYRPGALERRCPESAEELYESLVEAFAP